MCLRRHVVSVFVRRDLIVVYPDFWWGWGTMGVLDDERDVSLSISCFDGLGRVWTETGRWAGPPKLCFLPLKTLETPRRVTDSLFSSVGPVVSRSLIG